MSNKLFKTLAKNSVLVFRDFDICFFKATLGRELKNYQDFNEKYGALKTESHGKGNDYSVGRRNNSAYLI